MIVYILLLTLLCMVSGLLYIRSRKNYRSIDRMLDCVLSQEELPQSDLEEGEISALANKINRIQEILGKQVEAAEEEKEQVKSLVANMSHQLKTPLANLSLYTEIMTGQRLDEEQRTNFSDRIQRQIERLDWIVSSLSKMVNLEQNVISFELQECPLKQTIQDSVDAVYDKTEKKDVHIVTEPFEDCLLLHNRKWTVEVFVNILENAVKYMDMGGTIQIRVHPYEIYTEIQFADNGRGIPERDVPGIFRRFYRSSEVENIEGSGIGLYLSSLILEREKGYMSVKSVYGKGSCFSVFLQNCKK